MRDSTNNRTVAAKVAAAAALAVTAWVLGQAPAGDFGRALDRNLQLGSGGYNTSRGGRSVALNRPSYAPGSSKPLWTVSSSGGMSYSPHNAFNPRSTYTVQGYTDDFTTPAAQRRVRYGGGW